MLSTSVLFQDFSASHNRSHRTTLKGIMWHVSTKVLFTGRDAHNSPRHQKEKRFLVLTAERGCVGLTEEDFSLTNDPNMKLLKGESQRDPHGHIPAPPHTPNAIPQI